MIELLEDLPVEPDAYALELLRGVEEHCDELDELLREYSEHWAVERMPAVDRAVLRLGCYELAHEPDVPTAVVISEAVDLAKQYSTKDSGSVRQRAARAHRRAGAGAVTVGVSGVG